ncbi:ubiquitin C-terminal hydrolase [Pyrenophora seminiperda CCB06]|uniref:ubiquitinyl hydrolase 1 n=1 Tax=Pyrenophora seminiperda CCB06 TaxID=1302712 RepID=A0A3M7M9C2_9PLEO|nr:ubiquitin C-terminal hydrolase [Pyrenophora seminiperda CCB06]
MNYEQYPEFQAYQQRWNSTTDSHTTITTVILGAFIACFVLFKAFDFLGFPVSFWVYRLLQMAMDVVRLRGSSFGSTSSESTDDETQRGGMLGSLFALRPGSLIQKGVRGVANALSIGPSEVPPGLGNISNSCYQNSVIQGLASLPSLRDHLATIMSENPSLTPESTNGALFEIITKLNNPENKGQHFWIRGKLKSMSTFEQQDAQEYFSKILDALDEEAKKTASSKRRSSVSWLEVTKSLNTLSVTDGDGKDGTKDEPGNSGPSPKQIPSNPLEGRLAQRVGCTSCGYSEGLTLIPFNCMTVSLGKNTRYDIRDCLDEYTTLEFINGVECAKCTLLKLQKTLTPLVAAKPESPLKARLDAVQEALEKEDFEDKTLLKTLNVPKKNWVQSTKSKQAVVARAPQSLVLHVNRSSFNEYTGMPYKNTAGVSYPTVLDLGNWCLGGIPSGSDQSAASEEQWPRDPKESMLPKGEPMPDSPFQYRLRAAVTHYGSHGNGHYVCYRSHPKVVPKTEIEAEVEPVATEDEHVEEVQACESQQAAIQPQSEQWWRFSDDSVYPVSEEEAHQGNVFMLFYERIDESTPSVNSTPAVSISAAQDAPLPPVDAASYTRTPMDDEAITIALPEEDDDDLLDLAPSEDPIELQQPHLEPPATKQPEITETTDPSPSPSLLPLAQTPTPASPFIVPGKKPQPELETEPESEASDADSITAPSTQLTSDNDSECETTIATLPEPVVVTTAPPTVSPNMMRTAGNKKSRKQGSRRGLPLVSAT